MVLLLVNILILVLPVAALGMIKLYENELVRGTEAQLLTLAAALRDAYSEAYGRASSPEPQSTSAIHDPSQSSLGSGDPYLEPEALIPELDVSRDTTLPQAADATTPDTLPDAVAVRAGLQVARQVESVAAAMLAGVRIVDRHGIVIATSGTELGLSLLAREEVAASLRGERISLRRERPKIGESLRTSSKSRSATTRVFVALPVIQQGIVIGSVIASRTPPGVGQALYAQRRPLGVGLVLIFVIAIGITWLTHTTIAGPLRRLMMRAESVSSGASALAFIPGRASVREVEQLAAALDRMASTLQQRTTYIQAFANHVSHEFKTPLSTLRGTVELLQDHLESMTSAERARFLQILDATVDRMQLLTQRLLQLARADMLQPNTQTVELGPLLQQVCESQRARSLMCHLTVEPASLCAQSDPDVLSDVLQALCDNARLHGGDLVQVWIEARRAEGESAVTITVRDDGPGIALGNRDRLFTPFFTTAREQGGTGLGLTIVRSLLSAQRCTIECVESSGGAAFRIRLQEVVEQGRASPDSVNTRY